MIKVVIGIVYFEGILNFEIIVFMNLVRFYSFENYSEYNWVN